MKIKKTIGKIHLWLGLASGLIVIILGITGCLYVFEEELRPLVHKHYHVDEVKKTPLPFSKLLAIAETQSENPISGCKIYNNKDRTVAFWSFNKLENNSIWYWDDYDRLYIYIDPYTGKVEKLEDYNFEFFFVVRMLHQTLFLKHDIGDPIVGTATILFVISLITGLILWWPKNKSAAKQRFWFRWKDTTKWKRKNYDLHNILGYYMMIFALIIALTGLIWAFEWYDSGLQWALNGGQTIEKSEKSVSDTTQVNSKNSFDKIYNTTKQLHPKADNYILFIPKDSAAAFNTFIKYENCFNNASIEYDQYSGKILKTNSFDNKNTGEKFRSINYDLHVGSILGLPGKVLAFFASFVSAGLPITGFLIWWGRNKKKKKDPAETGE
ncbi:PepSY-associated TM helix domain-containing protein [Flavobacterium marginilacus]|uniref:PepSY-associated TM helix domain-containing protein n=1 Tax=Flavobacterium marginilacus TaxID=3003256 RepID=UPI00248E485E|nr:PepSY-associated TM helix domain-containing protein [Flavobacterium marginilacus]